MTTPEQRTDALRRFELCRRLLSHGAVLTDAEIASFGEYADAAILAQAYEYALDAAHDRWGDPGAALPTVDAERGIVRHQTCTGTTTLTLHLQSGELRMTRDEPVDPKDAVRTALAVLTGYLADPAPDAARDMPDLTRIDPRESARYTLARIVGHGEAEELIRSYRPHWEAWQMAVEGVEAQRLAAERDKKRCALIRRITPPVSEEPLTEWEQELLARS